MFSFVFTIITTLVIALFGIFTYLSNPENQTNRYYALSTGFIALWIVANYIENEPLIFGYNTLPIFLKLDFALAIIYFFVWFVFCYSFALKPFPSLEQYKVFPILTVSTLGLALLSFFSSEIITNITYNELIRFEKGALWWIYALHMLGTALGGLLLLFYGKRIAVQKTNKTVVRQINTVFLGFFFAFGNGLFINLVLQPFFPISIEISRFGIYGLTVFVALTSYAIVKYHFFDIKLTLIRTFSFFCLSLVMIILYTYVLQAGIMYIYGIHLDVALLTLSTILTTVVALSFHPLQRLIAEVTNHLLHKNYYDSEKLLAELTHIMASNIHIDVMTQSLLLTLKSSLHLMGAAFIIYKKDWSFDLKTSAVDENDKCLDMYNAKKLDALYKQGHLHLVNDRMCRFQDIEEGPTKDFFRELHISVVIPVRVNQTVIALLVLGDKKSGEVYSQQDLEFFNIFADEVGIAIQNTQSYREISEFNAVLEARVHERTKQLQEAQVNELKKAINVTKLRDEFVFIATHELRAPITAIRLFLEMASLETENIPEKLKAHLKSMHDASDHLNQLIDDLLEIARSDSGTLVLKVQSVDLVLAVQQVVHELQSIADARGITITYINANETYKVQADESKLKEVISNLISNAIKYNKDNGSITITFIDNGEQITTEIHDTGYGIPKEYHDNIFNKFFRATNKDTEEVVGTGLGLFISRMLVEKLGGTIKFSSVESMGSTFVFTLNKTQTETEGV